MAASARHEGGRLEPQKNIASCFRGDLDIRSRRVERDRHVDPAEGFVPNETEVVPLPYRIPVEAQGVIRATVQRLDPCLESRQLPGIDCGAVEAGCLEMH